MLLALAAAALLFLALASPVVAAKGGNGKAQSEKLHGGGSGSAISIVEAGPYTFGDQISFAVSTSKTDYPWVRLSCSQYGELVYFQAHGLYDSYRFDPVFTLGPTGKWTGGAASCEAELVEWVNGNPHTLATLNFNVEG